MNQINFLLNRKSLRMLNISFPTTDLNVSIQNVNAQLQNLRHSVRESGGICFEIIQINGFFK